MDVKRLFTNILILGLFIFGMMAFIVITQTNNSVKFPMADHPLFNSTYGNLSKELSGSQQESQTSLSNFGNVTPTQQFGELEVKSIIPQTRIMRSMIIGTWSVLIKLPQVALGVSPIVASIISSIVIMLLIIGIWAIWKGVVSS